MNCHGTQHDPQAQARARDMAVRFAVSDPTPEPAGMPTELPPAPAPAGDEPRCRTGGLGRTPDGRLGFTMRRAS